MWHLPKARGCMKTCCSPRKLVGWFCAFTQKNKADGLVPRRRLKFNKDTAATF